MRSRDFLIEYKRDITAKNLGSRLLASAERENITDVDQILAALEEMDPTPNKQYTLWLANQYNKQQFRLEDRPRIKDVLEKFINAKSRLEQRDINRYDFHSLEDAMDRIYNVELQAPQQVAPETQQTFEVPPNTTVLYNGPLGLLAVPKTQKASCILGSGTKWCTAGKQDNLFSEYHSEGPLYIWRDKNGEKYQFHFPSGQFMNSKDRQLSATLIKHFAHDHPVLKKLFADPGKPITTDGKKALPYADKIYKARFPAGESAMLKAASRNSDKLWDLFYYTLSYKKERWPELEKLLLKDPHSLGLLTEYAIKRVRGRWPEAEQVLIKHPDHAIYYAKKVLKGRWPEIEAAIAKDPKLAHEYADTIIQGRFPAGEAAIAKDPGWAYDYAADVIGGRFPAGEAAIAKNREWAYLYARNIIRGRWPEAEKKIASDIEYAYEYARNIVKGRWPEAEKKIASDPEYAYEYARKVVKGRFPAGESAIKRSIFYKKYKAFVEKIKAKKKTT